MYKLVAIDLDGTLLNSYGEVSQENRRAIREAKEKGMEIVLASGRVTSSVENIAREIGADHYLISGNGSLIYDMQEKKIIYNRYLERKKVLEIIQICQENSIYYNVYTDGAIITNSLNYNVLFYHKENSKKPEDKRTIINVVEDPYQYIKENENMKFSKITICDSNQIIFSGIIRKLRQIQHIDVLDVAHMSRKVIKEGTEDVAVEYFYTEITNEKVDKWYAISYLADQMGILHSEIMAIGDNINDKLMIQHAGLGVAMGGSTNAITEVADQVVKTNNEDGVAESILSHV